MAYKTPFHGDILSSIFLKHINVIISSHCFAGYYSRKQKTLFVIWVFPC